MVKDKLDDTTFIIPYTIDSVDRIENFNAIIKYLSKNFHTHLVVVHAGPAEDMKKFMETTTKDFEFITWEFVFVNCKKGEFHRTKIINEGIRLAKTPYISIYDADCIFQEGRIYQAVEALRKGATLSYPYSGDFVDIERSYLSDGIIKKRESLTKDSVGGACFLNREDYIKCGGEREEFQSWCSDDVARKHIIEKLGYDVKRIEGVCYHITHHRGPNSGPNAHTPANLAVWNQIKDMRKYELLNYLKENSYL